MSFLLGGRDSVGNSPHQFEEALSYPYSWEVSLESTLSTKEALSSGYARSPRGLGTARMVCSEGSAS